MKLFGIITLVAVSALNFSVTSHAQNLNYREYYNQSMQQQKARQALQYQEQMKLQALQQKKAMSSNHRHAVKPMTESMLKERLDKVFSVTKMQLSMDKQQADNYAKNFSRVQKQQAEALNITMKNADNQRAYILMSIKQQHERIMDNFKKHQINKDSK